jgi:alpha/beta hydrolase family protein
VSQTLGRPRRGFSRLLAVGALALASLVVPAAAHADTEEPARATVTGPITGPGVPWNGVTNSGEVLARGFTENEYFLKGNATSYRRVGTWGEDGAWAAAPDGSADYATRVLVRAPADPARFNGTVVVEWLNVSAGFESAPDWLYQGEEILRGGYAWIGVSAQAAGIDGPASPFGLAPLKRYDPQRYGELSHPGDEFSYDMYTQVARAVRDPGAGIDVLAGLPSARKVLAIGESQSAFRLVSYADAVQPLTHAYDGFLIHSRFAGSADLAGPTPATVRVREDVGVPVLVTESETDVVRHFPARQPDDERYRLWEIAGTSHVDASSMGAALGCDQPVNSGPQRYVMRAALRGLRTWTTTGTAPPSAPRLGMSAAGAVERDGHGNALGGIRTPHLDVPVATLSGEGNTGPGFCFLAGTTVPFDAHTLSASYASTADYTARFDAAADAAIATGFVLGDDRAAMHAEALKVVIPPREDDGNDIDVRGRIEAGALTATQGADGIKLSDVTLDGKPQTARGALNSVTVKDTRGSALGWELTGAVTDFTSDTGGSIPGADLSWTPACAVADPASPSTAVAGSAGPVGTGALLCRQTAEPGTVTGGAFTADAALALALPAYLRAGHYTAELVLTLV